MKRILLISAVLATLGLASANLGGNQPANDKKTEKAAADGEKKPAAVLLPSLVQYYAQGMPPMERGKRTLTVGDCIQFQFICSTGKAEALRDLKVDIKGNAVEKIGVFVALNVRNGQHQTNRINLHCLAKAVKAGDATVSITPVGEDGKEREARVIEIQVIAQRPAMGNPER